MSYEKGDGVTQDTTDHGWNEEVTSTKDGHQKDKGQRLLADDLVVLEAKCLHSSWWRRPHRQRGPCVQSTRIRKDKEIKPF